MDDLKPFEEWTQKSFEKVAAALKSSQETNRHLKETLELVVLRMRNIEQQIEELKYPNRGIGPLKPLDPQDGGV